MSSHASQAQPLESAPQAPRPDAVTDADARFLAELGQRVRSLRGRRGMTRRQLAQDAGVSERYLGQLETGDGNVSVMLLRRIASALAVTPAELLVPEDRDSVEKRLVRRFLERLPAHRLEDVVFRLMRDLGQEEAARRRRIALIGLRGAGKSTLGARLAAELRLPFVELNREVERETGLPVAEVIALYGQAGYRRIERRSLDRVLRENERAVISPGGGVVSEEETFDLLLANCYTVWLRASPEEHMSRVLAQGDLRPMAGNDEAMDDLRRILDVREPLYRKADAIVDTSGQTPEQSLARLRDAISI
jgi:XRE family aerobic/anaerobic benzoate catabolism transcriptional regulator